MFVLVAALACVVTACSENEAVVNNNENLTFQSRVEIGGVFFSPEDINESAMISKITALLTEMKKEFLSYKDKNKILERGITEECQETLKGMAP